MGGSFWILAAALLCLDAGNVFLWFLFACALHELGHAAAIWLMKGEILQFRLTAFGAVIVPMRNRMFSYAEEVLIALAGPGTSIALAFPTASFAGKTGLEALYLFAGLNFALGLFNLIPAGPLDGGRILWFFLSAWRGPDYGEKICRRITAVIGMAFLAVGLYVVRSGGNFVLLLAAIWLLAGNHRN